MSGKHPASFQKRDESSHPLIKHALDEGYLNSGNAYLVTGFTDHDSANQGRLSVNRGGRHFNIGTAAYVVDANGEKCWEYTPEGIVCRDPGGPHQVHVRFFSKDAARGHIVQSTGGDPSKLRYNPWKRRSVKRNDDGSER